VCLYISTDILYFYSFFLFSSYFSFHFISPFLANIVPFLMITFVAIAHLSNFVAFKLICLLFLSHCHGFRHVCWFLPRGFAKSVITALIKTVESTEIAHCPFNLMRRYLVFFFCRVEYLDFSAPRPGLVRRSCLSPSLIFIQFVALPIRFFFSRDFRGSWTILRAH